MIGTIATWLITRNFSAKWARPFAWLMIIVAVLLIAAGGWLAVKRGIISQYDAKTRADVAEQTLERTHKADAVDDSLEKRDAEALDALKKVNDDATMLNPVEATQSAGPVSRSALDELRRQRAAGKH